jgi:hypothetical protein
LLSGGTMATCEGCCHLTGAMLNLAAEAADRARMHSLRVHSDFETTNIDWTLAESFHSSANGPLFV